MIEQIKNILEEVKGEPGLAERLTNSSRIIDELELDSLEMLEFMLQLEDELKIAINFEKFVFENLSTIEELSQFLSTMPKK